MTRTGLPAASSARLPGNTPGTGTPGTATPGTATPGTGTPGTGTPGAGAAAGRSPLAHTAADSGRARRAGARPAEDRLIGELLARVQFVPDEETLRLEDAAASEGARMLADLNVAPPGEFPPTTGDPDCAPPDGEDSWLSILPSELLAEYSEATAEPTGPEVLKAGFWDRSCGQGTGFACGGAADRLTPGPVLARLVQDACDSGLGGLSDDALIGVLRAARRLASWSAALELSAAGDLMRRRLAEEADGQVGVAEHASDEIAAALALTGRSAGLLADRALALSRLPATTRALSAGDIDLPRALVIADELAGLSDRHAAIVERVVAADAVRQTTGELRATVRRAVIAADPAAARTRKERAQRDARVERWDEPAGTSALAGRDLPAASALEADHHVSALARALRDAGAEGSMDQLRAQVFLALLAGRSPQSLLPAPAAAGAAAGIVGTGLDPAGGVGASVPAGAPGSSTPSAPAGINVAAGIDGPAGVVNLTLPLATWLGMSEAPGEVTGHGPLDADDSRALLARLARNPLSRWCLTLTDSDGSPIAHGCARAGPAPDGGRGRSRSPGDPAAWLADLAIRHLEAGLCSHQRRSPGYRPPPSLQHLIRVRHRTCAFPGCRRPSTRCDQDHTLAYDQGGKTCECNLAPLCRKHHRAKQTRGWHLEQPEPGILIWTLPSGRDYVSRPTIYPDE